MNNQSVQTDTDKGRDSDIAKMITKGHWVCVSARCSCVVEYIYDGDCEWERERERIEPMRRKSY